MDLQGIETSQAPRAIGAYSQAVRTGELVFVSGQIPLDPKTGELVPGDIRVQTAQAINNLRAILDQAGSGLDRVIKVELFLADMADFAAVDQVYAEHFGNSRPARQAVGVGGLPKGAGIEVSCLALVKRPA
jgi:2-iminobutanoate/2-iminopropanoate deaminase